jgi:hypothetical protein
MAARKSCTHLTWAEAKGNVGGTSKKKFIPKNTDHGKALTDKVLSKNGASRADIRSKEKTLFRRAKRDEEKAVAIAANRAEEKEKERRERLVKPFDQAKEKMGELARTLQQLQHDNDHDHEGNDIQNINEINQSISISMSDQIQMMSRIAECRELQWNEVMGLEAIYADTFELLIANSSDSEKLQQHIEQWQMMDSNCNDENETLLLLQNIVRHPPMSFTLQLTVDGTCEDSASEIEIAVSLLLRVTMPAAPALYPLDETSIPIFDIEYFIATDREAVCNPDKQLESLAYLEEGRLKDALEQEAKQILPDPCVYEVVTACLVERLFDFVRMSVHAQQHAKQQR